MAKTTKKHNTEVSPPKAQPAAETAKSKQKSEFELRVDALVEQAKKVAEAKNIKLLEEPAYVNLLMASKDNEILDGIIAHLQEAYGEEKIYVGYMFDEITEKIITIANKLTYAKSSVRELIDDKYYKILNRPICDMIRETYGRLPFFKEAQNLELVTGEIKVLDPESVGRNLLGKPTDIAGLNTALSIASSTLGLISQRQVTQDKADEAWTTAVAKATAELELHELKNEIAEA